MLRPILKRLFDVAVAVAGLVFCSPLLAMAAVVIRTQMGPRILIRQARIGYRERLFDMLKLRTMTEQLDHSGQLLSDEVRLSQCGRLLRRWSLDELPQLWNVLRGEMSLVGPRPLPVRYGPRYTLRQRQRHGVKPGITGWAQVNGRNALTWEQKFDFDVWYVEHWSLGLDIKILWLTVLKVIRREGISHGGHATMPEFLGSAAPEPGSE